MSSPFKISTILIMVLNNMTETTYGSSFIFVWLHHWELFLNLFPEEICIHIALARYGFWWALEWNFHVSPVCFNIGWSLFYVLILRIWDYYVSISFSVLIVRWGPPESRGPEVLDHSKFCTITCHWHTHTE